MTDNTDLNPGTAGDKVVTREISHAGDTAKLQGVFAMGISGAEGSYTAAAINGDATNGLDVDVTRVGGDVTVVQATAANLNATVTGTVELGATALAALETITVASVTAPLAAGTNNIGDVDIASIAAGDNNIGNVDVVTLPALPAGTNNIGDVDVLSIIPGTAATSLGKAEDAAHASGDTGVMALAVRRDADTALAATDGDYVPLQCNAAGSLKVAITAGAGSGGTSIADGASFTRDTTSITPVGGVVETNAPTVIAGDAVALSLTTGGAVRVAVASGGITGAVVDSVAGATDEGVLSIAVRDDALATLTPVDGDYTQTRVNARGALWVALDSTAAQTVTLAAGTATNEVVGDAAADAAVAGNPLYMGARASTAVPTAMSADGDAVGAWADLNGALVVAGRIVDDAAFTPGTSRVHPIAFQADETATDSVDEGDAGCPRMTLDRKVIVTPYVHAAAGGTSNYTALSTAAVLTAEIKGSAGKVYSIECFNVNAAARFVRLYNQTGAPASTDTANVVWQGVIPGATTGGGFTISWPMGRQFATGIGIRASTGIAHNDTGALGANELTFNVSYA